MFLVNTYSKELVSTHQHTLKDHALEIVGWNPNCCPIGIN